VQTAPPIGTGEGGKPLRSTRLDLACAVGRNDRIMCCIYDTDTHRIDIVVDI
jgi:hypothetical protein